MNDILAEARKAGEQAEVFFSHTTRTPVRFEANQLKQVQTKESTGTALRLVKNGKIGFSAAAGPVKAADLVRMAEETAQFGPTADYDLPGKQTYPQVDVYDPKVEKVSVESMVELGKGLIETLRDHTPDVVCEGVVTQQVSEVRIVNTKGGEASYRRSVFSLYMEGVLVREGGLLYVGDGESSTSAFSDVSQVASTVKRQLDLARVRSAVPTRTMPVVFTPIGIASALVAPLAVAFNGKMVVEGSSPLRDRRGERVFDAKFSLRDDSTMPLRPTTCPCDDEGVPSQRTDLVQGGVVKSFLFDLRTAKLAGQQSTGSGRRAGGLPGPGVSSLVIGEGEPSLADMLKDIKEGLMVEMTMGTEQGNLLSGDFAGNVLLGFAIRNGEVVGRVKDTVISGNVYKLLGNIGALGRESRWVSGFLRAPYILCPEMSVASKMV